jgi:hypothetical protein
MLNGQNPTQLSQAFRNTVRNAFITGIQRNPFFPKNVPEINSTDLQWLLASIQNFISPTDNELGDALRQSLTEAFQREYQTPLTQLQAALSSAQNPADIESAERSLIQVVTECRRNVAAWNRYLSWSQQKQHSICALQNLNQTGLSQRGDAIRNLIQNNPRIALASLISVEPSRRLAYLESLRFSSDRLEELESFTENDISPRTYEDRLSNRMQRELSSLLQILKTPGRVRIGHRPREQEPGTRPTGEAQLPTTSAQNLPAATPLPGIDPHLDIFHFETIPSSTDSSATTAPPRPTNRSNTIYVPSALEYARLILQLWILTHDSELLNRTLTPELTQVLTASASTLSSTENIALQNLIQNPEANRRQNPAHH